MTFHYLKEIVHMRDPFDDDDENLTDDELEDYEEWEEDDELFDYREDE